MKLSKWLGLPLVAMAMVAGACTAEVEDEGSLPEVNVEGGDMPSVDVEPADVDVTTGTDTSMVVTPDVDVDVN